MTDAVRIAMWSGPRNISTAMMRAFDARGDCAVVDEPFYAYYLASSGVVHPMNDEILASQPQTSHGVVEQLFAPLNEMFTLQYQKQMAHHMVGDYDDAWFCQVRHAFLVRDPAAMIASYTQKRGSVRAEDLGLARQVKLYKRVCELTGQKPPVIDSKDVLENPAAMLRLLCEQLGVEANLPMCNWPKGRRDTDGVWASHWYNAVEASTGFAPYKASNPDLDSSQKLVLAECEPDYEFFHQRRLRL